MGHLINVLTFAELPERGGIPDLEVAGIEESYYF